MYKINLTPDDIKSFPLHSHRNYEIMVYLSGTGYMKTTEQDYPFKPGSVIIVPPETKHGSVSESGFKNISIEGEFENIFHSKSVISLNGSPGGDAAVLAKLIYGNRFNNSNYLTALCSSLSRLIATKTDNASNTASEINRIIYKIGEQYFDSELDLTAILKESGYAVDYIRARFKEITRKTPSAFLNEVRISRARFLIDVYSDILSLSEISEKCGYNDYIYFSRTFKAFTGVSPSEYRKETKKA